MCVACRRGGKQGSGKDCLPLCVLVCGGGGVDRWLLKLVFSRNPQLITDAFATKDETMDRHHCALCRYATTLLNPYYLRMTLAEHPDVPESSQSSEIYAEKVL